MILTKRMRMTEMKMTRKTTGRMMGKMRKRMISQKRWVSSLRNTTT